MYIVVDTQTGIQVASARTRAGARRKADRLDAAYGAVRFTVTSTGAPAELRQEATTND